LHRNRSPSQSPVRLSPARNLQPPKSPRSNAPAKVESIVPENSKLDKFVREQICMPILDRIPPTVTPNSITGLNFIFVMTVLVSGFAAPRVETERPEMALGLRTLAGLGIFVTCILDNLDGMQARKTGQGSKLGMVLDHFLDALALASTTAAALSAIGMLSSGHDLRCAALFTAIINNGIYNAQVTYYYASGDFVHPPNADGTVAQCGAAVLVLLTGPLFYFGPPTSSFFGINEFRWTFIAINIVMAGDPLYFYYPKLVKHRDALMGHFYFVGTLLGFLALTYFNQITYITFLVFCTALSFRLNGTYVVSVATAATFSGWDSLVGMWAIFTGLQWGATQKGFLSEQYMTTDFSVIGLSFLLIFRNMYVLYCNLSVLRRK